MNYERERKRTVICQKRLCTLSFHGERNHEISAAGIYALCSSGLSFLQKYLGTASDEPISYGLSEIRERRKKLNYQFKDALTSLSVAVQAGYSVESAVNACARDLERLYGRGTDVVEEFRYIESQQHVSVPLEELFLDLGERSQVEDIENFASVFYTAKRTGGDMNKVIQKVTRMLGDKIDVKKEIEATLAAKKSEQMIMSLMPAGIIVYLQMTSPGFLNVLYGNPFGIAAMSVCLAIYITAYWMGRKIVDIEV